MTELLMTTRDAGGTTPPLMSLIGLTLRGALIEAITAFRSPELFPLFGLPEHLPGESA